MDVAFETMERFHIGKKRFPHFYDYSPENIAKLEKLFEVGACYPLAQRDELGRKVVVLHLGQLDTEQYHIYDGIRLMFIIVATLLEEPETQIAGMVFIFDYADVTLKQCLTPTDGRDFMDFTRKCCAVRQKGNYLVNFPSFATFLFELAKSMSGEKLSKRLFMVNNFDELAKSISPSILSKEMGGSQPKSEMLEAFKVLWNQKKDLIYKDFNLEIDWNKVSPEKWSEHETVGSFRKLEID